MVKELSKPKSAPVQRSVVETISGIPLKAVYTAQDLDGWDYSKQLADPVIVAERDDNGAGQRRQIDHQFRLEAVLAVPQRIG